MLSHRQIQIWRLAAQTERTSSCAQAGAAVQASALQRPGELGSHAAGRGSCGGGCLRDSWVSLHLGGEALLARYCCIGQSLLGGQGAAQADQRACMDCWTCCSPPSFGQAGGIAGQCCGSPHPHFPRQHHVTCVQSTCSGWHQEAEHCWCRSWLNNEQTREPSCLLPVSTALQRLYKGR